jgi:2-iminobutanoate/2-iminopropanoate deaminase
MTRTIITTKDAPAAVGPYSQGVRVGNFVYTAGQIPLDPATGQLVEGGIETQTERVLLNIQAVLAAAGSSLDQVVKTTVFLTDMADFQAMNGVYGRFFPPDQAPPARSTVAVVALPLGVRVEIEAVALVGGR